MCNTFTRLDGERLGAAIPAGDKHLPLVIGIDQADQVAEDDTMLVAKPGARQQYRRQSGIGNMNRKPRRYESGFTRRQLKRRIKTGTHIHACGPVRGVVWQGEFVTESLVEYLKLNLFHGVV